MPEQGTKPQSGTALMGIDPTTGIAYFLSVDPATGNLVVNTSGGGGGGAVTIANGADVAEGSTTDAAAAAGGVGTVSAKLRLATAQLATINTTLGSNMAVIGPTPDGTAASTNPVLVAGTTDGTATGLVAVPKVTAGGVVSVDGSASTQPVSASSLPLPTGAATSAAQATMATNQTNGTQQTRLTDGTNVAAVKAASTAPLATDPAAVFTLSPNSPGLVTLGQAIKSASVPVTLASDQGNLPVSQTSDLPSGATQVAATSGNVANATAAATLAGTSGKTTFIQGFTLAGSGATVGLVVDVTITNLIGSVTFHFAYAAAVGALVMNSPVIVMFPKAIAASGQNTSIVVSCPALGAGNTNNAVNAFGYQQ